MGGSDGDLGATSEATGSILPLEDQGFRDEGAY